MALAETAAASPTTVASVTGDTIALPPAAGTRSVAITTTSADTRPNANASGSRAAPAEGSGSAAGRAGNVAVEPSANAVAVTARPPARNVTEPPRRARIGSIHGQRAAGNVVATTTGETSRGRSPGSPVSRTIASAGDWKSVMPAIQIPTKSGSRNRAGLPPSARAVTATATKLAAASATPARTTGKRLPPRRTRRSEASPASGASVVPANARYQVRSPARDTKPKRSRSRGWKYA